jgi:hypothetical protein
MEIWYDVACETRRSGVHGVHRREDGAECVVGGRSRCSRDLMQVKIPERPGLISPIRRQRNGRGLAEVDLGRRFRAWL